MLILRGPNMQLALAVCRQSHANTGYHMNISEKVFSRQGTFRWAYLHLAHNFFFSKAAASSSANTISNYTHTHQHARTHTHTAVDSS
jgi:hypothetical protein